MQQTHNKNPAPKYKLANQLSKLLQMTLQGDEIQRTLIKQKTIGLEVPSAMYDQIRADFVQTELQCIHIDLFELMSHGSDTVGSDDDH